MTPILLDIKLTPVKNITPQVAILIGSVLISLSILVHGGIIKIGKAGSVVTQPTAGTPVAQPQAKTDTERTQSFKKLAGDLKLDTKKFNDCFDSKKYDGEVNKDLQEGSSNGIQGTPGTVIITKSGKRDLIGGALPIDQVKAQIDALLK